MANAEATVSSRFRTTRLSGHGLQFTLQSGIHEVNAVLIITPGEKMLWEDNARPVDVGGGPRAAPWGENPPTLRLHFDNER